MADTRYRQQSLNRRLRFRSARCRTNAHGLSGAGFSPSLPMLAQVNQTWDMSATSEQHARLCHIANVGIAHSDHAVDGRGDRI
nr:hypothetical protein [Yoonia sp.]